MPRHSYRLVILACVSALFIFSYADVKACPEGRAVIFFTNGILTTERDAEFVKLELERKLQGVLSDQVFRCLEFEVSYNATRLPEGEVTYLERLYNGSLDTAQALGQNVTTFSQRFWTTLAGIEAAPDWLQEEFLRSAQSVNRAAIYLAPEIVAHQERYEDVVRNEEKKVLAVGHSQGNFYANQTYFLMPEDIKQYMGIVSVATFDSFVAGQDQPYIYTNLVEDLALDAAIALASTIPGVGGIGCTGGIDIPIDGLELLNMWPLCPNTTNAEESGDWKGHNFITAYLVDDSNSENMILVDILDTLNGVQNPNPTTSTNLNIGDTIEVISDLVNIKDSPPGNIIGSANIGDTGIVIEGPELLESSWWWNVDFDSNPDGWVIEDYLQPSNNAVHWLSFIEGYPGVPNDAITIHSSNYILNTPIWLSNYSDFTIGVFPPDGRPIPDALVLQIGTTQNISDPCYFDFGSSLHSINSLNTNGVPGVYWNVYSSNYAPWIDFANSARSPECPVITISDLSIRELWPQVSGSGVIPDLDASYFGVGLNTIP